MPANTTHMKELLVDLNQSQFAEKFINMPKVVIERAEKDNYKRVAIIGTKFTMTEDFYSIACEGT